MALPFPVRAALVAALGNHKGCPYEIHPCNQEQM